MGLHDEQISYRACPISYLPSWLLHIKRDCHLKVSLMQTYYNNICWLTYQKEYIYIFVGWTINVSRSSVAIHFMYLVIMTSLDGGSRIESVKILPPPSKLTIKFHKRGTTFCSKSSFAINKRSSLEYFCNQF